MEKYTISCFNQPVKELIEEYESGKITILYGNSASGITTSCLLAAISCAKQGNKVIYVDTESNFNSERLKQLYFGDIKDILDNIFLIQPKTFKEQHDTILKLKKLCEDEKIKLIIVDTIGSKYRVNINNDAKKINKMMVDQLKTLVRIARDLNKIVLMTNQVGAKLDGSDEIKMVGGKMIENMAKVIIELRKKDEKRTARLVKYKYDCEEEDKEKTHPNLDKEIEFEIKEKGLFLI